MKYFLIATLLLFSAAPAVWGQVLQPAPPFGAIDWSSMQLQATGQGFASNVATGTNLGRRMAERAALLDARRNLLELFLDVRVDSKTLVRDFVVRDDIAYNRLAGALVGCSLDELRELEGGGVEVRITAPLGGDIAQALWELYPPETAPLDDADDTNLQILENHRAPEMRRPVRKNAAPGYTGLIIDARDLNFTPSLRPTLHGPQGLLYPTSRLSRDLAASKGFVAYYRNMHEAAAGMRSGASPLILKASRLHQGQTSALELENKAAELLRLLSGGENAPLLQAAVSIVY